jgi:hypothetical protein
MLTLIVAAGFVTAFVVLGIIVQKIGGPSVLAIFFAFYAIYDLVMWIGEKRARLAVRRKLRKEASSSASHI